MTGIYLEWAKEFLSRLTWYALVALVAGGVIFAVAYAVSTTGKIVANVVMSDPSENMMFLTSIAVAAVAVLVGSVALRSWESVNRTENGGNADR